MCTKDLIRTDLSFVGFNNIIAKIFIILFLHKATVRVRLFISV